MAVTSGNRTHWLTCGWNLFHADLRAGDGRAARIGDGAGECCSGLRLCKSWQNKQKYDRRNDGEKIKQNTNGSLHGDPPLPSRAGGKGCPRVRDRFRLGGCGLRRSPGSAALRRAAFPSRHSGQWLARNYSALQSRVGDGFAPSSRHGVSGGCGEGFRHRGLAGTLQSSG